MLYVNVTDAERVKNPHGVDIRKLIESEGAQIFHVTLKPGGGLKRHTNPGDAFLYIIKGRGIVKVGDEEGELRKATLVYLPKGVSHSVTNTGSLKMEFLVMKVM
ncbi:cupin domain-containing protein [Thermococcus sp.]|uniref:cupin domain-containing protein n=1 Tax=Thermococcus sp. TaxID=35749 RepID=UPI0025EC2B47|nr:cupin domain-containing protein [Thermococcus sp.]